jgi:hypothetical protein
MKYQHDFLEEFVKDIVATRIEELYQKHEKITSPDYDLMDDAYPDRILDRIELFENIEEAESLKIIHTDKLPTINAETQIFHKYIDELLSRPKKDFMREIEGEFGLDWSGFKELMEYLKSCYLTIED